MRGTPILEGTNDGGVRVELVARCGTAFEKLTIDVSFGNAITPAPVRLDFPTLLGGTPHPILGYPLETVIAEKFAAAVELGLATTRLKDFYDLHRIVSSETLEWHAVRAAITLTCGRRGTPLANSLDVWETLLGDARLARTWTSFLARNHLTSPGDFPEVMRTLSDFFTPIVLEQPRHFWQPAAGWQTVDPS
ncbi:MAG: nucleotidyl transferase AbiEii/AbiGii toxin family protein [Pleurocapsa sp. SU_196_0]|nr:nucleotidyl transferase AbiEii/AbiGii toxin family protein [Pleurocapsa sp. SU_196_0]